METWAIAVVIAGSFALLFILKAFVKPEPISDPPLKPKEAEQNQPAILNRRIKEPTNNMQYIVVTPTKSMGVSLILTILLGPLGMLYSTVVGGLFMMVISVIVGFFTLGFGLIITWPICIIWGAMAVSSSNKKILTQTYH